MKTLGQYLFVIFVVAVALGVCLFVIQNSEQHLTVKVFLWESQPASASLALFAAFGVGVGLTFLGCLYSIANLQMKVRKSRKLQTALEREIDALRNQPLYEESAPSPKRTSANPLLNEDR